MPPLDGQQLYEYVKVSISYAYQVYEIKAAMKTIYERVVTGYGD